MFGEFGGSPNVSESNFALEMLWDVFFVWHSRNSKSRRTGRACMEGRETPCVGNWRKRCRHPSAVLQRCSSMRP